jgi:hypothetical protein
MEHIESVSCVRFVNKENRIVDYRQLFITAVDCDVDFCAMSDIGYKEHRFNNGLQIIVVKIGCKDNMNAVMLHELMHTLGFGHEHQRFDRDNYVYVANAESDTDMDKDTSTDPVFR